ncbi:MAG: hypothetical protein U5K69_02730 [Balneolaceae bacterium]|nr:hypothetical protein [Balneolaceae bacterium]
MENIQVQNLTKYGDSVRIKADFSIKNYAISYTDGIDYRPLVVGSLMSNPFDKNTRCCLSRWMHRKSWIYHSCYKFPMVIALAGAHKIDR